MNSRNPLIANDRPRMEPLEARLLLDAVDPPPIVINEIHYDPDVVTELAEFIELYNAGPDPVDISGWSLTNAVDYTFPATTQIPSGDYVVVAQDPQTVLSKFGTAALGPWDGRLDNDGDHIVLRNDVGDKVDEVTYKRGFPWPTIGDSPGHSIELVNPALDNDLGGSWRASIAGAAGDPTTLVAEGALWRYMKGQSEASSPTTAWRAVGFDDTGGTWADGLLPIGYGEGFLVTNLGDMRSSYTSVFLRKAFDVTDASQIGSLVLEAIYDDGFNAWINGVPVVSGAQANMPGAEVPYDDTANGAREDHDWNTFNLPSPAGYLVDGQNVLAIQLHNASLSGSSDCFINVRLKESAGGGGSGPSPTAPNNAYATNVAPHMRQVNHSPKQPVSGEPVKITVKVTDDDGVQDVTLHYQLVNPGSYIESSDPAYLTNWTDVAMVDDGTGGDELAGDGIYTAVLPGALQTHRRLVRYKITAEDTVGLGRTGPYSDDPGLNFAYFVYDGVPSWSGAINPNSPDPAKNQAVEYSSELLTAIPVYHLITTRVDHVDAMHIPYSTQGTYGGDNYLWDGALVYDGEVYDHVHYRARGGVWRYAMGKNMWKFDFNRGHSFQARDDYGRKYDTTWDKLNFSAIIQQGNYLHRGEQGMFEAAGFELFNLMGVEAPKTHWVHFRIIESANESGATQYDGDFQGMYLVIEQMDGRFLNEHDLPDGNLYKIEGHNGSLNNQGPTAVTDKSDFNAFKDGYYRDPNPTEQWWRTNVDLDKYYSYRAVVEGIHHGDIGYGKNYFFYLNPETNVWSMLPWDLDLIWANNMYGNGEDPFKNQGAIFSNANLTIEYKNRLREFEDLLYNTDQLYAMLDEMASIIDDPLGGPSLVDADRAMWDYNPIMTSSYVNSTKSGAGRFYQQAATKDFPGMVQIMKNYVVSSNREFDSGTYDPNLPATPVITYVGPAGYPINNLTFRTTPFVDGTGFFSAMEWRVGEITDPAAPAYDPDDRPNYEIEAKWESGELTVYSNEVTVPSDNLKVGHAYRARVRMRDSTGRWSRWSAPVEFISGEADETELTQSLRITEMMYNPADPTPAEAAAAGTSDNDEFEFIEIYNQGPSSLDISGVSFTRGIAFSFAGSGAESIAPGQYIVVAKNPTAFAARYNTAGLTVVGGYPDDFLANGGERITLYDALDGDILDYDYSDNWYGHTDGDGFSLTVRDVGAPEELWDSKVGWRSSELVGGTPGGPDLGYDPGSIVVNEVLAHSDGGVEDWIELYNASDRPIDIGGWWLSDQKTDELGNETLRKYEIAAGTTLEPGQYVAFSEVADFGTGPNAFALSEYGDDVYVSSGSGGELRGYREHVDFGASPNGVSFGRHVKSTGGTDFTLLSSPTWESANAVPYVGDLVLNEIMYNPVAPAPGSPYDNDDYEYVELYNRSGSTIDLTDYYVADGIRFSFGWYDVDGFGTAVWTRQAGATATWQTVLPESGNWEVLYYCDNADGKGGFHGLDDSATYDVVHATGTTPVNVDQAADPGQWVSLGTFGFNTGVFSRVTLRRNNDTSGEWTLADGIKFVKGLHEVEIHSAPDEPRFSTTGTNVTSLAPGQYVVIVKNTAAFDERHDIAGNGIVVAGEYTGNLANNGELVKVFQRSGPEQHSGFIPVIRADHVNYDDSAPWQPQPDGAGSSLSRKVAGDYGNEPTNWAASVVGGTPGALNVSLDDTPPTTPQDVAAAAVGATQVDLTWTASADPDSGVDHYTVYRNGLALATTATPGYEDTTVVAGVPYVYQISATNGDGLESDFSTPAVTITVVALSSVYSPDSTTVRVVFTEPVTAATAEQTANYTLSGRTVTDASLAIGGLTVNLTTSELVEGQAYNLTVNNVLSVSGNPLPPDLQESFTYSPHGSGTILREYWTGIAGSSVSDLTGHANYPDDPTGHSFTDSFEAPTDFTDTYGTRMQGYVHPPATGNYIFWIASDDSSELWLSSDDDPANAVRIASVSGWTNPQEWTKFLSQQSAQVHLEAGRKYYIQALHKEGSGGDNLAVGWRLPDSTFERPIPGIRLSPLEVQAEPPTVTVDPLATSDPTPPLTGSVSDPDATIIIRIDGGAFLAVNLRNGRWILPDNRISPPLLDGTYDVQAAATDLAGNTGYDTTTDELTIDVPGPNVTVDVLHTQSRTPAVTGTVTDPNASIAVTIEGNEYEAVNNGDGTWVLPEDEITPPLADGVYDVAAVATDLNQKTGIDFSTDELTIDNLPPTVTVDTVNTSDTTPELTGTVDDPNASIAVTVGGTQYAAVNNGDGTWTLPDGTIGPALADGTHEVQVAATDLAGNTNQDATSNELTIDSSPPSAPADLVAAAATSTRIDLSWDAAGDPDSGIDHYVIYRDGSPVDTSPTPAYSDAGLAETQTYVYEVAAVNGVGNEGARSPQAQATPRPSVKLAETMDETTVRVTFGKPVERISAETPGNYAVTDDEPRALPITSATLQADPTQVILTLGELLGEDIIYTLSAQGVQDLSGNPVGPGAATTFVFRNIDPDLLAWWTFDEGVGATAPDVTGNGRDVDVFGATWEQNGRIGGAMRFDGTDGSYLVDEDGEDYINGLSAFTVAMWIKSDTIDTSRGFFNTRDPGRYDCLNLRYDTAAWSGGANDTFSCYLSTTGADGLVEGEADTQTTGWQHVAFTWADGGTPLLYLDGALQTPTFTTGPQSGTVRNATKVVIGKGELDTTSSWLGLIDDVRIYGRQLGAAEVEAVANLRPIAQSDGTYEVDRDETLVVDAFGVLDNDTDPDAGPQAMTALLVADVSHGQLNLAAEGSFDYTPTGGYTGPDGFTYRAFDGLGYSKITTVTISVVDTAPPTVTVDPLVTADATPALTGTVSDPAATIAVTVAGRQYGAINNGDGTWTLPDGTIAPALADGTYDVQASATSSSGKIGHDATTDELTVDATAPTIERVLVGSTSWSAAFVAGLGEAGYAVPTGGDQLNELPWANLDQLTVVFSEETTVGQGDLALYGVALPEYGVAGFEYDADALAATWTLSAPMAAADKLLLSVADAVTDAIGNALDGEWADGISTYSSGDGQAGGSFNYRINILPGDADQSGEVRSSDVIKVRRKGNTAPGDADYSVMYDVDGSGEIRSSDVIKVRRLGNTALPAGEPTPPPAPPAANLAAGLTSDPLAAAAVFDSADDEASAASAGPETVAAEPVVLPEQDTAAALPSTVLTAANEPVDALAATTGGTGEEVGDSLGGTPLEAELLDVLSISRLASPLAT